MVSNVVIKCMESDLPTCAHNVQDEFKPENILFIFMIVSATGSLEMTEVEEER